MLDRASWLPQAEALNIGQSRRVPHDCGEGRTLKIERNASEYRAWCFRCGEGGAVRPVESTADKLARARRLAQGDAGLGGDPVALPQHLLRDVGDWPEAARTWVFKAGLGRAEIGRLGLGYHPESDRVVLPVLGPSGAPCYWQARAYQPGRMPKYLGPTPKPRDLLSRWGSAESPTLCEDILSAMKVGMVGEGWAILGTHVSDHMIAALLQRKAEVSLWTDADPAGINASLRYSQQLRRYGLKVHVIRSTRDPKLHTFSEIQTYLSAAHSAAETITPEAPAPGTNNES